MKNKLLITTALAGVITGSSAFAQTSVTGSLDIHYRSLSFDGTGTASRNGFGRETQLNVQNKGKLNNGIDYAAGFSLEFDGQGSQQGVAGSSGGPSLTETASISNENVYVDFIMGSTTLTVGVDHVQNSTTHSAPMVRNVLDDAGAMGALATDQIGAKTKEAMYYGIVQDIPGTGIKLSAIKAPQGGAFGGTDQSVSATGYRNGSYEVGLTGTNAFGVSGLKLHAFTNKEKAELSTVTDLKGTTYGIGYTFGQFAAGVDIHKTNRSTTNTAVEANMKNTIVGVTYAATKDVTVGALLSRNTNSIVTETEKIKSVQVGYNLGPVAIIGHYDVFDGIAGSAAATAEGNQIGVRVSSSF